jgi:hypothetical protein
MQYTLYDKITGALGGSMSMEADHVSLYESETRGVIEGNHHNADHSASVWVDASRVVQNREPVTGVALATTVFETPTELALLLTDLPGDCWLRIRPLTRMKLEEQTVLPVDGELKFTLAESGRYSIEPVGRWAGEPWLVEAITLEALKERRTAEVDERKASVIDGGVLWSGHRWDADDVSRAALRSYVGMVPTGFFFTDYDNEQVPLDLEGVSALAQAMANFSFAVHAQAQALKVSIRENQTIAAVLAVDVTSGWPN